MHKFFCNLAIEIALKSNDIAHAHATYALQVGSLISVPRVLPSPSTDAPSNSCANVSQHAHTHTTRNSRKHLARTAAIPSMIRTQASGTAGPPAGMPNRIDGERYGWPIGESVPFSGASAFSVAK